MNRDRLHGRWRQWRGKWLQLWGTLRDDPHAVAAGLQERHAGEAQTQRGSFKQEADRQLADFFRRNRNWQDLWRS